MTNEQALQWYKLLLSAALSKNDEILFADSFSEAAVCAIKALNKQIPKKPLTACGHTVDKSMTYCPICGQRLDWSED